MTALLGFWGIKEGMIEKTAEYSVREVESIDKISKARRYIEKCAEHHHLDKEKLKNLTWFLVCDQQEGSHRKGKLEPKSLFVKIADRDDPVWKCKKCEKASFT